MTETPHSILLVDVSGIFHSYWHIGASDVVNEARRSTVNLVRRYLFDGADGKFDRVALCCDGPNSRAARLAISPDYKQQRPPADKLMLGQLDGVIADLGKDGCHVLVAPNFEADDVIASVVAWARSSGAFGYVSVMSDDKDMAQLVHDPPADQPQQTAVSLYRPRMKSLFRSADVKERWGVRPDQMGDFLALCGDASDNIAGVKGCGGGMAVKLLQAFDDLAGITEALAALDNHFKTKAGKPTKLSEALQASIDLPTSPHVVANKARQLVALFDDILTAETMTALLKEKPMQRLTDIDRVNAINATMADDSGEMVEPRPPEVPPEVPTMPHDIDVELSAIASRDSEPTPVVHQAMVVHPDQPWAHALEPTDLRSTYKLASAAFESRLFSAYGNPEAVMMSIIMGRELGLPAMTALRAIHVIKGKPVMSAQLLQALVQRSDDCEYFTLVDSTPTVATYETKRRGNPAETRMGWTMAQAEQAGLTRSGGNWAKYPATMLRWRCVAELCRAVYPDVVLGIYTQEELES